MEPVASPARVPAATTSSPPTPMLPPHPNPLAPLRPAARLRFRLHFLCSPYPSPLLSSPCPRLRWPPPIRAHASAEPGLSARRGVFGVDALLSAAELLCLLPPAICSVVYAARLVFPPPGAATAGPPPLLVLQYVLLVAAVALGSLIRRRQSRPAGGAAVQVGKVEETVRAMVAAVALLSKTVEKLGNRFRLLRRTLREPITETAALAQKNSEATRILSAQEDLLEKEIGAIQKVLYAMQEQQQKQLDLILAIGVASRILDGDQDSLDGNNARSTRESPALELENKQVETESEAVSGGNNTP